MKSPTEKHTLYPLSPVSSSTQSMKPRFINPKAYLTKYKHFDWGLKGAGQQQALATQSSFDLATLDAPAASSTR